VAYRAKRSAKERLKTAIEGTSGQASIGEILDHMTGWLDSEACLVVRFEDLVGPEGGGEEATQMVTLKTMYDYIGLDVDEAWMKKLRDRLFSASTPTFRRGAIGGWRDHFDDETRALFKRVAGEALVRYGYEKDDDW
jgi:hypothetical protein